VFSRAIPSSIVSVKGSLVVHFAFILLATSKMFNNNHDAQHDERRYQEQPDRKMIQGIIVKKKKISSDILSITLDSESKSEVNYDTKDGRSGNTKINSFQAKKSSELNKICFMGAIFRVSVVVSESAENFRILRATNVHLLRCAPDPRAVEFVVSFFAEGSSVDAKNPPHKKNLGCRKQV